MTTATFALPFIGVAADLALSSGSNLPFALLALAPLLGGTAARLAGRYATRMIEQNAEIHRGVFETVLALAEEHAVRRTPAKVRVGGERGSDGEHDHEEVVPATGAAGVHRARA